MSKLISSLQGLYTQ